MSELRQKRCKPCEGGVDPLSGEEASALLKQVHEDWSLAEEGRAIVREFQFRGFARVMGFVNAIGWIATVEGHHPDITFGYGYCRVRYSTHAIGGLSENDFICAARVDALIED